MVTYSLLESVMAYVNCNASVLMVGERSSGDSWCDLLFA